MAKFPRLIGVIHLPALGGSPGAMGMDPSEALQRAGLRAVEEARVLTRMGFEALVLENFGDTPFYKDRVPPETIASMSVIAAAVREATKLPIGINVLRNDAFAALGIAAATGCQFIRVNVLQGLAATDQGLIEGDAARLIRERDRLGADIQILADAHVKHAQTLSSSDIELAVEETALRARADGVILTGSTTGREVNPEELQRASRVAKNHRIPLFIGSGATPETIPALLGLVHGVIVGSALRAGGKAGTPLDLARVRAVVGAFKRRPSASTTRTKAKGKAGAKVKTKRRKRRAA